MSLFQQLLRLEFPSIWLFHLLGELFFLDKFLLDLLFLVQDFLGYYLLVVRVEVQSEVVFDEDEGNDEVVSCVVFFLVFFNEL